MILRYKGGLGNQMFIYAMQLALEKHYPDTEILADTSRYMLHNEHNGYELPSVWGIDPARADVSGLRRISPYLVPGAAIMHSPKFIRDYICSSWQYRYYNSRCTDAALMAHYYKQPDHEVYDPSVWDFAEKGRGKQPGESGTSDSHITVGTDMYLDGLWQNVSYFEGVEDEIRRAFCVDRGGHSRFEESYTGYDRDILKKIQAAGDGSVSIHVRRGDFTGSKFDICGAEYYRTALERLEAEKNGVSAENAGTGHGGLSYFVFTDDAEYAADLFEALPDVTVVEHDAAHSFLDMDLMSRCRNHIISNSTFSWWGAYLSGAKEDGSRITGADGDSADGEGVTIAPKYSLCRNGIYTPLSVPEGWIQIEIR